jgi:hypothetical protein
MAEEKQQTEEGQEEEIKHSSDQPVEGEPNEGTGEGISSEKPVEG